MGSYKRFAPPGGKAKLQTQLNAFTAEPSQVFLDQRPLGDSDKGPGSPLLQKQALPAVHPHAHDKHLPQLQNPAAENRHLSAASPLSCPASESLTPHLGNAARGESQGAARPSFLSQVPKARRSPSSRPGLSACPVQHAPSCTPSGALVGAGVVLPITWCPGPRRAQHTNQMRLPFAMTLCALAAHTASTCPLQTDSPVWAIT